MRRVVVRCTIPQSGTILVASDYSHIARDYSLRLVPPVIIIIIIPGPLPYLLPSTSHTWALVNMPGRVLLGGPSIALGYWKDPDATAQRFVHVPLQGMHAQAQVPQAPGDISEATPNMTTRMVDTGDIGFVDAQGRLHIVGRADLQLLVEGVRVDAVQVQHVLQAHATVADAIVFVVNGSAMQLWGRSTW